MTSMGRNHRPKKLEKLKSPEQPYLLGTPSKRTRLPKTDGEPKSISYSVQIEENKISVTRITPDPKKTEGRTNGIEWTPELGFRLIFDGDSIYPSDQLLVSSVRLYVSDIGDPIVQKFLTEHPKFMKS